MSVVNNVNTFMEILLVPPVNEELTPPNNYSILNTHKNYLIEKNTSSHRSNSVRRHQPLSRNFKKMTLNLNWSSKTCRTTLWNFRPVPDGIHMKKRGQFCSNLLFVLSWFSSIMTSWTLEPTAITYQKCWTLSKVC